MLREVSESAYQVDNVDLLDAHSFLWTLNPEGTDLEPINEQETGTGEKPTKEQKVKVGAVVYHKDYGEGTISRITEENIYVRFDCGQRIFPYPEAIEKGWLRDEKG